MVVAKNKKAYHDYFIDEKYEAGMELLGPEVKSIKAGKASIKESFVRIINGEIFVMGMHVTAYKMSNIYAPDEHRVRKLLLHKKEIKKLHEKVTQKGFTIVPLQVYITRGMVKIQIGLARGKKNYDKRDTDAKRSQKRDADRAMKDFNR